jgi:hypothetical protein
MEGRFSDPTGFPGLFIAIRPRPARAARKAKSPYPGPAAALAFDDLVALFQQALALAILAFLLFLWVGALFIGHDDDLPAMISRSRP